MSYLRTPIYAWVGDNEIHLWARADAAADGVYDPIHRRTAGADDHPGFVSGVAMPLDVFDELVVMRYAELERDNRVYDAVQRVRARGYGNVGSWALADKLGELEQYKQQLHARLERKTEVPDADS